MTNRLILYPIVILFALAIFLFSSFLISPLRNLRSISKQVNPNQSQTLRTFSSFAKTFPKNGYVLTFHTNHQPEYNGAEFVTITNIRGRLIVELIIGPGKDGVVRYRGEEAQQFINEHEIDLSKFEAIIEKNNK
jgi:hypothetical protein